MIRLVNRPLHNRASGIILIAVIAALFPARESQTAPQPVLPRFTHPLNITNTYHPFVPGGVKIFMGEEDGEEIFIMDIYSTETRAFHLGNRTVRCRILQETEFADDVLVEISQNYFAQADDGSVYYFGETVDIYEDGEIVAHDGSWLVGGATQPDDPPETATATVPALFMPANPRVGDTFKPEDLFPIVDETVEVLKTDVTITVPAGTFEHAIKVRETTQLSDEAELKWYAPGAGVIRMPEAELESTTFVSAPRK